MDYEKLKKNLENNGFAVSYFDSADQAVEYLNKKIDGKSIGFGGSMTIQEIGLADSLAKHNKLCWHWQDGTMAEAMTTDVYMLSANAIAETGEIINIDGTCNRIASALFGHEELYYIVGKNKIAEDFDKALYRARNVAAPLNAKRLNKKTPCAVKGDKCYNCNSPERICHALTVTWRIPGSFKYGEVILINEYLGF